MEKMPSWQINLPRAMFEMTKNWYSTATTRIIFLLALDVREQSLD